MLLAAESTWKVFVPKFCRHHTHTHTLSLSLHDDAVVYDIGAGGDRADSAFLWIEVIVWFFYVLILF